MAVAILPGAGWRLKAERQKASYEVGVPGSGAGWIMAPHAAAHLLLGLGGYQTRALREQGSRRIHREFRSRARGRPAPAGRFLELDQPGRCGRSRCHALTVRHMEGVPNRCSVDYHIGAYERRE